MTLAIVASAFGAFHAIPATESTEMTVDPERSLLKKNAALTRHTFRRWPWASGMKSIFAEAVEQDFLLKDPTRGIKIPRNLREKDKTTPTWHQLRAVLASVTTRDRMLLTLEMTDALRPSELFALPWRSFDGSKLTISETTYRGKIRPFGKTEKSLGDVFLPKGMVDDLWLWKQESPDSSPDTFIFPNTDGGFMDTGTTGTES